MNAHLEDAFANRFAVAKISKRCTAKTRQNPCFRLLIGKP
jgi:hypothetical protein